MRPLRNLVIKAAPALLAAGVGITPIVTAAAPASATVSAGRTHYIEIGGLCDSPADYYNGLDLGGGDRIRVVYPASMPGACGTVPFNASIEAGRQAAEQKLLAAYHSDPAGRFVVAGYSQGAVVAEKVLGDIADNKVAIPHSQVGGKLYSSALQPITGIGSMIPTGIAVPVMGLESPGPGRANFNDVKFDRFCITDDGICDTRNPFTAVGGYFAQHPCYRGAVMPTTIADPNFSNGTRWWPKVDCHVPWPTMP